MRYRVIVPIAMIAIVLGVALALTRRGGPETEVARSGGGGSSPVDAAAATLPPRTLAAGAVDVTIEPLQLDDSGAVFLVTLDTHSEDLGVDLARTARLEVDGTVWDGATWAGDPPGGHHRQGELSFRPAGPASGTARLTIDGLPEPVVATWTL